MASTLWHHLAHWSSSIAVIRPNLLMSTKPRWCMERRVTEGKRMLASEIILRTRDVTLPLVDLSVLQTIKARFSMNVSATWSPVSIWFFMCKTSHRMSQFDFGKKALKQTDCSANSKQKQTYKKSQIHQDALATCLCPSTCSGLKHLFLLEQEWQEWNISTCSNQIFSSDSSLVSFQIVADSLLVVTCQVCTYDLVLCSLEILLHSGLWKLDYQQV